MVNERTASVFDGNKKSVYYVDGRANNTIYQTVGTGEIQEQWINIAGAKLATSGHFAGRNIIITTEVFLSLNPDIIMVGAQNQANVYELIISDNILSELNAVKNGQIYRIPQGMYPWCRTGPEGVLQVIWAAKLFHPNLFEDIDIATIAKDFYREFYGADISDAHLQGILRGQSSPNGQ
jgi:iron complex transport system substrate-binding protein